LALRDRHCGVVTSDQPTEVRLRVAPGPGHRGTGGRCESWRTGQPRSRRHAAAVVCSAAARADDLADFDTSTRSPARTSRFVMRRQASRSGRIHVDVRPRPTSLVVAGPAEGSARWWNRRRLPAQPDCVDEREATTTIGYQHVTVPPHRRSWTLLTARAALREVAGPARAPARRWPGERRSNRVDPPADATEVAELTEEASRTARWTHSLVPRICPDFPALRPAGRPSSAVDEPVFIGTFLW